MWFRSSSRVARLISDRCQGASCSNARSMSANVLLRLRTGDVAAIKRRCRRGPRRKRSNRSNRPSPPPARTARARARRAQKNFAFSPKLSVGHKASQSFRLGGTGRPFNFGAASPLLSLNAARLVHSFRQKVQGSDRVFRRWLWRTLSIRTADNRCCGRRCSGRSHFAGLRRM